MTGTSTAEQESNGEGLDRREAIQKVDRVIESEVDKGQGEDASSLKYLECTTFLSTCCI